MQDKGSNRKNGTDRGAETDSDILLGRSEDAEILTDGGEQDDDQADESRRLDNPAWKDRLRTDGGVEIDDQPNLATLECQIRGQRMFEGDDDGAE